MPYSLLEEFSDSVHHGTKNQHTSHFVILQGETLYPLKPSKRENDLLSVFKTRQVNSTTFTLVHMNLLPRDLK